MSNDFFEANWSKNLTHLEVADKLQIYNDMLDLENGLTGRMDVMFSNTFILESLQLIANSITLFEDGFFDAAFYSLRESLEISTTVIYLVDDNDENRALNFREWRNENQFPGQSQMLRQLSERSGDFADLRDKMSDFFENVEKVKKRLNKYIHKQGYNKFYISRNHWSNLDKKKKWDIDLLNDFQDFLRVSIGALAVYRLAIDPLPVALADDQIYNRTSQFLTDSYSQAFMEKYIGMDNIALYKQTKLFRGFYEELMLKEEMNPSITSIIKDEYIDLDRHDEIKAQWHLLSDMDKVAVFLMFSTVKIVKIHCFGGLRWYFCNRKSNRTKHSLSSEDFDSSKVKFNSPYDEVFLTHFSIQDEDYFLEHNDKFESDEIDQLKHSLREFFHTQKVDS